MSLNKDHNHFISLGVSLGCFCTFVSGLEGTEFPIIGDNRVLRDSI
jgi:hypothetical protein